MYFIKNFSYIFVMYYIYDILVKMSIKVEGVAASKEECSLSLLTRYMLK